MTTVKDCAEFLVSVRERGMLVVLRATTEDGQVGLSFTPDEARALARELECVAVTAQANYEKQQHADRP
jgi:hypothetical protein